LYVLRPLQPAVAPGPPVVSRARPRPEGGGFLHWQGSSTQEIHATAICLVLPTQRRRRLNLTDPSTNPCEPLDHRFAYTRLHIDERLFKQKRFLGPQVCFQMRLGSARLASFHVLWHILFPAASRRVSFLMNLVRGLKSASRASRFQLTLVIMQCCRRPRPSDLRELPCKPLWKSPIKPAPVNIGMRMHTRRLLSRC
jgi:hypothetical protein